MAGAMAATAAIDVGLKILELAIPSIGRVMEIISHARAGNALTPEQNDFLLQQQDYWENKFDDAMLNPVQTTSPVTDEVTSHVTARPRELPRESGPETPEEQPPVRAEQNQTAYAVPPGRVQPPDPAVPHGATQGGQPVPRQETHLQKEAPAPDDPGMGDADMPAPPKPAYEAPPKRGTKPRSGGYGSR